MKYILIFFGLALAFSVSAQNVGINTPSPFATLTNNGSTGFTALTVSNLATGGNIGTAAATVDIRTCFLVNQTTAAQTITLPNPTDASAGRVETVTNTGTVGFRLYNNYIEAGQSRILIWSGAAWSVAGAISGIGASYGDLKHGIQTADHNGWVKLDGRAKTTLTASQQAQATALGIGTNLPDATNRTLLQSGTPLTTGGSNSITIAQTNLPNVNFTGSTSSNGDHQHPITCPVNSSNNADSQGWPQSGHFGFRTTDRTGLTINNGLVNTAGAHTHTATVASGGSGTAITTTPAYVSANTFIYLGL